MMLPVLQRAAQSEECTVQDLRDSIALTMRISPEDQREMLGSGTQTRLSNRVHWARHYMLRAGLLETPRRGAVKITERGLALLDEAPSRIDVALLKRYEEFREFLASGRSSAGSESTDSRPSEAMEGLTPEDLISQGFADYKQQVTGELLDRVRVLSPLAFERLVLDLLQRLGYGGSLDITHLGGSGDGGVDGVIKEDKLGLDLIYVQAKRWQDTVGRPIVQSFAGSLEGFRAKKGVMITTSTFSPDARAYVRVIDKQIVLVDGKELADYMYETGLGVSAVSTIELKAINSDFFIEE